MKHISLALLALMFTIQAFAQTAPATPAAAAEYASCLTTRSHLTSDLAVAIAADTKHKAAQAAALYVKAHPSLYAWQFNPEKHGWENTPILQCVDPAIEFVGMLTRATNALNVASYACVAHASKGFAACTDKAEATFRATVAAWDTQYIAAYASGSTATTQAKPLTTSIAEDQRVRDEEVYADARAVDRAKAAGGSGLDELEQMGRDAQAAGAANAAAIQAIADPY